VSTPPSAYDGPADPSSPPDLAEPEEDAAPVRRSGFAKDAAVIVGSMALLGVLCGVLWAVLVDPAQLIRTNAPCQSIPTGSTCVGQDELQLSRQFAAEGWYAVIAAVTALMCGLAFGFWRRRDPMATLLLLMVGCAVAAVLMLWTGQLLGPSDPTSMLESAAVGKRADVPLDVAGIAAYLAWPMPALLGILVALFSRSD
jgi:hypothetical protein